MCINCVSPLIYLHLSKFKSDLFPHPVLDGKCVDTPNPSVVWGWDETLHGEYIKHF